MNNFKHNYSRGSHGKNKKSFGRGRSKRYGGRNSYRNPGLDLDPMMFVKKAVDNNQPYIAEHKFSDFPLNETVKNNIQARGFDKPTEIQDQALMPVLLGRDVVGIANTGTGKTAVFLLALITKAAKDRNQKTLIITPTRELAVQIQDEFKLFSQGMNIYSVLCIGGVSLKRQAHKLLHQPNFVIGTPGRIKDLQKRHMLNLNQYKNVVLDEVDRMLDMGFIRDIREIISFLAKDRQSLFFSATIPEKTKSIMRDFLTNPITVSVKNGKTTQNVNQDIIRVKGRNKINILHQLLIQEEFKKVLLFGRTKRGINDLQKKLIKRGFKVAAIHGNKSQNQRLRALNKLKNNEVSILLATDVASRGLDINNITHVINYDVPETYNDYVHRIGRTGRAGKTGVALTFVN